MDRNKNVSSGMPKCQVALRKESVDRNFRNVYDFPVCVVALRKESVDRNINCIVPHAVKIWSLSARRAWIEMFWYKDFDSMAKSRSPQGERG